MSPEAAPRWLDERERAAWIETAVLVTRLPAALDAQLQRDAGLTFFEYQVLSMLSMSPDRTRQMSDLAALTAASLSRLSHVVSRLERRGHVRRSRCPGAVGRATNATLTDEGYAKVVACAPGHVAAVRELLVDALAPAELDALAAIGRRLRAGLDAAGALDHLTDAGAPAPSRRMP